jgi:hypothetical protein
MKNEYLDKVFSKKEMIKFLACNPWKTYKEIDYRTYLCKKYAWAIPNEEAISIIVEYSPIIEMGAGAGYWASLIASLGGDIVAVDKKPISNNRYCCHAKYYHPVIIGDESLLDDYLNRTLFICWGFQDETNKIIERYIKNGGKTIIMVIEECAADIGIFADQFEIIKTVKIPQWEGIHDKLVVYQKRS